MISQLNTKTKKSSDKSSFLNTASQTSAFNPRPFVTQAKTSNDTDKPDLKTSLKRAEKYGHNPNQIQSADISSKATPIQTKIGMEQSQVIQLAPSDNNKWKKRNPLKPFGRPGIADTFEEGDKLYGLRTQRPQTEASRKIGSSKAVVIDQLNNQFLGTSGVGETSKGMGERAKRLPEEELRGDEQSQRWMNNATYGKNKSGEQASPDNEASEYQQWLEQHPKYSPTTQEVRGEPLSSPFRQRDRVKKSSKAGLEYTAKHQRKNVHFMLDGVDQQAIVNKQDHLTEQPEQKTNSITGDSQKSVTGSELRKLYRDRNDEDLKSNVNFYKGGKQSKTPWKKNPQLWEQYIPQSEESEQ